LNKVTVVQIDIKDPASGPTIFDSLNSRQEPMTIGDLVRNGIFSKVAEKSPEDIEIVDSLYWQPFYKAFEKDGKNHFDAFFFPYGLTQNPNLRKMEVYNYLTARWQKHSDPTNIVSELSRFQAPFMDVMCGSNTTALATPVAKYVARLHRLGAPTSVLPFLMILLDENRNENVSDAQTIDILRAIENFLVRRAVCGIEPTGLHSVFKRLWSDLGGVHSAISVRKLVGTHRTVSWPDDNEFSNSIKFRQLYGAQITPFLLWAYDTSLQGDTPSNVPWIEHVLPQTLSSAWLTVFSREEHAKRADTLGNLIPVSSKMNRELSNQEYGKKRVAYQNDSMYQSARKLANDYELWTSSDLDRRAESLIEWALLTWPKIQL